MPVQALFVGNCNLTRKPSCSSCVASSSLMSGWCLSRNSGRASICPKPAQKDRPHMPVFECHQERCLAIARGRRLPCQVLETPTHAGEVSWEKSDPRPAPQLQGK